MTDPVEGEIVPRIVGRAGRILDGWHPVSGEWETDEPIGKLLAALRRGASFKGACGFAKIDRWAARDWVNRGVEYLASVDDRMDLPIERRVFADLASAVEEQEGSYEVELANTVRDGAVNDPALALRVLTTRFPDGWSEKRTIDITSSDGSLVQDRIAALLLNDPALAEKAEDFSLAIEQATSEQELREA